MAGLIPEDFGSKWAMSDIVLKTPNADGKELHASKHTLATHSPFFQAMFLGAEWKEKNADSLELEDDYELVKEVLRILYQVKRSYVSVTFHSSNDLFHLYTLADKYDIPLIREMCKAELTAQPGPEALGVSSRLGLHDVTAKILGAVDFPAIDAFMASVSDEEDVHFDAKEVKTMLAKAKERLNWILSTERQNLALTKTKKSKK